VPRCGPLGGIATALKKSGARAVLFLACDMPLVSPALLRRIVRASRDGERAVFAEQSKRVGFPCALPVEALAVVRQQIDSKEFSLQALATKLHARRLIVPARRLELLNVNTRNDLAAASRALLPKLR
jgi:molybdopterin-guanine dinucleotide biosynthesis protein A